jgi:hypothetical protein
MRQRGREEAMCCAKRDWKNYFTQDNRPARARWPTARARRMSNGQCCSTPQWAWGAYLAGDNASPASAFGLVVGVGGGMEKILHLGRQWLWRNVDG